MFKRGVSPVVATVLLLVITVVLASVIFAFVVPFVNKQLGNSKACLNVLDSVEFPDSRFNCYKTTTTGFENGFSVKIKKSGVASVRVALIDANGGSDVKDIKPNGPDDSEYRMVGVGYGLPLDFPTVGGQKSYVTKKNKYSRGEISPITDSNDVCAVSDTVEFTPCTSDVVL